MALAILTLLGLAVGSFINALVWRLHLWEKYGKLSKQNSIVTGRSVCTHCQHKLGAAELIPLLSWCLLAGRCRHCNNTISVQYPLVELLTAVLFVVSWLTWPIFSSVYVVAFSLWLVILTILIALAVYDFKWMILPDRLVYPLLLALLIFIPLQATQFNDSQLLLNSLLSALLLSGFFYLVYQISQGKWIGGGDVKLGAALGFLVGTPANVILLLFIASVAGTLFSLPLIVTKGKKARNYKIPFGPFLVFGAVIVFFFGQEFIDWYFGQLLFVAS